MFVQVVRPYAAAAVAACVLFAGCTPEHATPTAGRSPQDNGEAHAAAQGEAPSRKEGETVRPVAQVADDAIITGKVKAALVEVEGVKVSDVNVDTVQRDSNPEGLRRTPGPGRTCDSARAGDRRRARREQPARGEGDAVARRLTRHKTAAHLRDADVLCEAEDIDRVCYYLPAEERSATQRMHALGEERRSWKGRIE